ncbi:MAG TPA: hypothetical protein PKN57_12500 [Saprospiraceae bacterium]|nr:hypothetical protein [Saprospiraceae bacterium]HMW40425.1 hypothetical protein [Saprospiraceae bacterium]HMX89657.1 hypothetical protein [Saprospiraceae bacterium]HMZ41366.1 hypothetical protein [Saprospiraceae bacterium]HNA65344.1 hypothetical protein [Saprospiraceae bacterium]
MNKIISTLVFLFFTMVLAEAQSFKYQGVARNNANAPLVNQNIALRLSILNASNVPVYVETHAIKTSDLGIFSVNVCQGANPTGNCATIDWSQAGYQLKVELDAAGGTNFTNLGNSPILAVPLANYATKAGSVPGDNDMSPTNEIQTLNLNTATNALSISQGNSVDLTSLKNDADSDPANEIQTISLDTTNNEVSLSKGGGKFTLPTSGASLWVKKGDTLVYKSTNNIGIWFRNSRFQIDFGPTVKRQFISGTNRWIDEWNNASPNLLKTIAFGSTLFDPGGSAIADHHIMTYHYIDKDTMFRVRSTIYTSPGLSSDLGLFCNVTQNGQNFHVPGVTLVAQGAVGTIVSYFAGAPGCGMLSANVSGTAVPYMGIFGTTPGTLIGGMYRNASGQSVVQANIKNFVMDHPTDPTKEIWYACVEGPEAAAYNRGTATLVNGEAYIKFSDDFHVILNPSTLTVNLTPLSAESEGLAVVERNADGFKVRELHKGKGNYKFDWQATAVRKGYEDFKAVRTKGIETVTISGPNDIPAITTGNKK